MTKFQIICPTLSPSLLLQYSIFSRHALMTSPFQDACFLYACMPRVRYSVCALYRFVTLIKRYLNCYLLCYAVPPLVHIATVHTVLSFTANVTLLLRLSDEFDGIWTFCGFTASIKARLWRLRFYDHSDIMAKMLWSQGGHIKRRPLYRLTSKGVRRGGWGFKPPIGLSTKMHSKENITFLALLSLFFCNDKDSNMI